MPWLDITDVSLDPMIAGEAFVILRRTQVVSQQGMGSTTVQRIPALGSVTPTGDNSLVTEDAYRAQAKTLQVVTAVPLYAASTSINGVEYQPDLILWNGDYYLVKKLEDYSSYGAGLLVAECASIDYVETPPP